MTIKDLLLSIFSGALLICAFPQWNINELAWIGLIPLLVAVKDKDAYHGFILGMLTGVVFNLGLVYWVTVSMTTYGKMNIVLSIVVLVMFALYLSLFVSVPLWCSCHVQQRIGLSVPITLPLFWTAAEYVKSWFLTGFPWENFGYSQYQALSVIQIADITGVYGITFLLLLANCTGLTIIQSVQEKRIPYKEITFAALVLAITFYYGSLKLTAHETKPADAIKTALIQGNISQDVKWDPAFLDATMKIYSRLTVNAASENPALIVWPEAATPFFFQSETTYREMVGAIVRRTGAYLLLGSPAWVQSAKGIRYFNSAFLLSPDWSITGRYDKIHLVPYGEYVPLKQFFPFIEKMVVGIGDFTSGEEISLLYLPEGSFGTLICYEIIFPDLVRSFAKKGAEFLVNITNDAWFGRTSAPYQHLSMAVLRAVENRRYVVRSANTGISAIIDANGRIITQSGLFTEEYLTGMIILRKDQTFYTHYGDVFALICTGLSLLLLCGTALKKNSKS